MAWPKTKLAITMQPVEVKVGSNDHEGMLVFVNRQLVAVLSRLDVACHGDLVVLWNLEAGFGPCATAAEPFASIQTTFAWVRKRAIRAAWLSSHRACSRTT